VVNSDGDDILFHELRFPLLPGASMDAVRARLHAIASLRPAGDCWNWVAPRSPTDADVGDKFLGVDTELDDGILLGTIRLDATEVRFRTNSAERAERGEELFASELDGLVGAPVTEIETLDELVSDDFDDDSEDDLGSDYIDTDDMGPDDMGPDDMGEEPDDDAPVNAAPSPEVQAKFLHSVLEKHYRRVLGEPVPMLGNVSPREAARTASGRAMLVEWLKHLEDGAAGHRAAGNPLGTYDLSWMWTELGIANLRK
jgi:hypothetical protein